MATVQRTIIVPAALVAAARNLGACLTQAAAGMFITPLSATGSKCSLPWRCFMWSWWRTTTGYFGAE